MSQPETLLQAIGERRYEDAIGLLERGVELNEPSDEGASPLFSAVLTGHLPLIEAMLRRGADPNFRAQEPASGTYCERPLDLAMQARYLMDWDMFHPVVNLLLSYGATDADGEGELPNINEVEERARAWQSERRAASQ